MQFGKEEFLKWNGEIIFNPDKIISYFNDAIGKTLLNFKVFDVSEVCNKDEPNYIYASKDKNVEKRYEFTDFKQSITIDGQALFMFEGGLQIDTDFFDGHCIKVSKNYFDPDSLESDYSDYIFDSSLFFNKIIGKKLLKVDVKRTDSPWLYTDSYGLGLLKDYGDYIEKLILVFEDGYSLHYEHDMFDLINISLYQGNEICSVDYSFIKQCVHFRFN